jgi:hypothetical protein
MEREVKKKKTELTGTRPFWRRKTPLDLTCIEEKEEEKKRSPPGARPYKFRCSCHFSYSARLTV